MIINIKQTSSNIKQEYEIESNDRYFYASAGSFHKLQSIVMKNKDRELVAKWHITPVINHIPFLHLFGYNRKCKKFVISENQTGIAEFSHSKHGYLKSCYLIKEQNGCVLYGYDISLGSFNYMCIFKNKAQIALVETYLTVTDHKYTHKLYLLEEEADYSEILSLFAVYYSNFRFSKRMHMSSGTVHQKERTFSKYNSLYDASWRETHFPSEDFFGKNNIFN